MSKSTQSEEINRHISRICAAENDTKPPMASIEPGYNRRDNDLDALSRLMTGPRDVCTALCFDGDKLLIANNSGDNQTVNSRITALQQFIQSPFKAQYENLEGVAAIQSEGIYSSDKIRTKISNLAKKAELGKFGESFNQYDLMKMLSDKNLSPQAMNIAAEILQPIIDTRRIANAITTNIIDQRIRSALLNQETNTQFIQGSRTVHAEMKILGHLQSEGKLQEGKIFDIGLSKLCCSSCAVTIDGIKAKYEVEITTPGTHGATYERWEAPNEEIGAIALKQLSGITCGEYVRFPELTINPDQPIDPRSVITEFSDRQELVDAMHKIAGLVLNAQETLKEAQDYKAQLDKFHEESKPFLKQGKKLIEKDSEELSLYEKEQELFNGQLKEVSEKRRKILSEKDELTKNKDKCHCQ